MKKVTTPKLTKLTLQHLFTFIFLQNELFLTLVCIFSCRKKQDNRKVYMKSHDGYILKQTLVFMAIAIALGLIYG